MSTVVLIVEYTLKPGQRDAYVARAREHRANVLGNEPGCKQFDLIIPDDAPDKVCLFEIYTDADAFDVHTKTSYMQEYRDDIAPMSVDRRVIRGTLGNE